MEGFKHSVSFNDKKVDLTNNKITLDEDHRFLNGEEVIYTAGGTSNWCWFNKYWFFN